MNKQELVSQLCVYPADGIAEETSQPYAGPVADVVLDLRDQITGMQQRFSDLEARLVDNEGSLLATQQPVAPSLSTGSLTPKDAIYLLAEMKKILLGEEEA